MPPSSAHPVIVFGAFDRHNFGDLLFPHIVSALLPQHGLLFAGLKDRDLRAYGGHLVQAIPSLLANWQGPPPALLHAGGELLGCDAWEAAVMLQHADEVQSIIKPLLERAGDRRLWAARYLGIDELVPYMVAAERLPKGARLLYNAVGGVDLGSKSPAMRGEALGKLAAADFVGVRDDVTLTQLASAGIAAALLPDPAAMTHELFGTRLSACAQQGEIAALRQCFPEGYLAMQFSAEFGDDATLSVIADQLANTLDDSGHGLVLFRAGAAPWHDDIDVYRRLAHRLPKQRVRICAALNIWDICALIASSKGYCGSSLHGRIVAMSCGLPRLNLVRNAASQQAGKQAAYAASWEGPDMPAVVAPPELHAGLLRALSIPEAIRHAVATRCASAYRKGFAALCAAGGL